MPSLAAVLAFLSYLLITVLAVVWWLRSGRRGLDWILIVAPLSFGLSYLSSILFRVSDFQAGCNGWCPGWRGTPFPTHISDGIGSVQFNPFGFIANAALYFTIILIASIGITWLAQLLNWSERRRRWRIGFALLVVILPLALLPTWLPLREPDLSGQEQRYAINAKRAWRWQLQFHRLADRRLIVEDVRLHPDGERHRVCLHAYTWFYIPRDRIYIDLEPAGVRATGGGVIPLSDSCWVQP